MNRKKETENQGKTGSMNDNVIVKKRGRPVGSKNKIKTTRKDSTVNTEPGENNRYILHDMKLMSLPTIDLNDDVLVNNRIKEYFAICADDDMKPSVASLALSFGMSRYTLFDLLNERNRNIKNSKSILTLKTAYNVINSYYEHMMNNGKINPVAGIFLMKNNMGYKDTTDYVISANQDNNTSLSDIVNRSGLLTDE